MKSNIRIKLYEMNKLLEMLTYDQTNIGYQRKLCR